MSVSQSGSQNNSKDIKIWNLKQNREGSLLSYPPQYYTYCILHVEDHLQRVLMKDLWMLGSLRSGVSLPGTGSSRPDSPWRHLEVKPGAAYKLSKKS